ncbi:hypothetical protein VNI00_017375 [Paramarasmius palmivorus]|uniref:SWIM-type domain-containing protein n=1 Tax=Paramarasmius palmivorus TaxID=297713 RepID=A0AAW0B798_9AGAR
MAKRKAAFNEEMEYGNMEKKVKLESAVASSFGSQPQSTPKKSKGKGKAKTADGPEKRLARFRGSCPNAISQRLERAMEQRFFLIDRNREDGDLCEVFTVSGSTGNVYTVTIDKNPRCNCPDCLKGNHCKHILFVFLKVLQVPQSSGHWYQKWAFVLSFSSSFQRLIILRALLSSELAEIFKAAPPPPQVMANEWVVNAWKGATGQTVTTSAEGTSSDDNRRVPTFEDDCAICYDTLHDAAKKTLKDYEADVEWCKTCHNAIHKQCWTQYVRHKAGIKVECVYCRTPWLGKTSVEVGAGRSQEGYVNLAGMPGFETVSPVRDTSTYYHGVRRGRGYGYYGGYRSYDFDDGY